MNIDQKCTQHNDACKAHTLTNSLAPKKIKHENIKHETMAFKFGSKTEIMFK